MSSRSWTTATRAAVSAAVIAGVLAVPGPSASAGWAVPLSGGSAGSAAGGSLLAPGGVTGTCGTGANKDRIVVTWSSAAHATTYTVQQSSTSATAGYATAATGLVGTTWTSPVLSNGSYWFRVVSVNGNWSSAPSPATAQRTIQGNNCT